MFKIEKISEAYSQYHSTDSKNKNCVQIIRKEPIITINADCR